MTTAEQFFFEHAGFSYDPKTQTPEQGKRECAKQLAAAEQLARDAGLSFDWSIDPDASSADWIDGRKDGSKYRNPWQVWQCVVRDETGHMLGSLHSIDFGRDGTPWGDSYRRVVEAELALEYLPS